YVFPGKRRHYAVQVIGRNKDVTVVDQKMVVLGLGKHLHQVAGLAVVAKNVGTNHQLNLALGKLAHQPMNRFHGGVVRFADAKNNLVFGIGLDAVAAEALIHLRVHAAQGFENGYWWVKSSGFVAAPTPEGVSAPQTEQIKAHAAKSEPCGYDAGKKM